MRLIKLQSSNWNQINLNRIHRQIQENTISQELKYFHYRNYLSLFVLIFTDWIYFGSLLLHILYVLYQVEIYR